MHPLSFLAGTVLLLSTSSVYAAVISNAHHDHASQGTLPDRWYHDDDHFAHALFRRQATTASSFPQVGTPGWAAAYPVGTPDSNAMPQAWKDALTYAVQNGKIPNIPPTSQTSPTSSPAYNPSVNPASPQVCAFSSGCRINGVIYDAPPGVMGLAFDDGPLPVSSDSLYAFLRQNQVRATHFFIGMNIIYNPTEFNVAFQTNQDDIAVHTWTHPYMTTLSNSDIVAQLGWSLQLIYNSTGGRLARYWRPPYGDSDLRVTSIAQEVFGLTTIIWNHDTGDWSLGLPGGTNLQAIQINMSQWISGPKTPGLIVLEHELTNASVQAFITAFPLIRQNGWTLQSVATMNGQGAYQNAIDSTSPPTPVPIVSSVSISSTSSSPSPSTTSPSSSNSAANSRASAASGKGNKNGAAPELRSSSLAGTLSLALALSLCLL